MRTKKKKEAGTSKLPLETWKGLGEKKDISAVYLTIEKG